MTYFVDSIYGSDKADGTTRQTAWRTLDAVNARTFKGGDEILFKAGCTFNGNLIPKRADTDGVIVFGRYGVGDQTNASRMLRQQQYITAASQQLVQLLRQDVGEGVRLLDGMGLLHDATVRVTGPFDFSDSVSGTPTGDAQGHYLMTNALRATIISDLGRAAIYSLGEIETLPGVHSLGSDGYIRFDMQQDAALRWALDVFYDNID